MRARRRGAVDGQSGCTAAAGGSLRRAGRIDANQPKIVKELERIGCTVQILSGVGKGVPDLAVGHRGLTFFLEVKNPEKPKADRQLTEDQLKWHIAWRGHVAVVETVADAFAAIGILVAGEK